MTLAYEPLSPADRANPYPVYAALRERDPVHWAPESKMFCVSRYEDVTRVLKHPELFSSIAMKEVLQDLANQKLTPRFAFLLLGFLWKTKVNPFAVTRAGNLLSMDPPRHEMMRNIVNRGFTPRRIASWETRAREIVKAQMRVLEESGRFDVVEDLAIPLPVTIIAEMLGVESERRADFKSWSDALIAAMSGAARENPAESGVLDVFGDLFFFLRAAARDRREQPRDDLISVLVDPAQEEVLSELDVVLFVILLLVAGNETTTNLIGNAVNALLDHPTSLERVAEDPSLVPSLVEETVRFDAPIQQVFRTATEDVEISGVMIPKGSSLAVLLASANRDPERFERPDEFDLDRDARGHVGFGLGVHFCLGSSLARLEARVALEALTPELPRLKAVGRRDEFIDSFLVRGRRHVLLAETPETV